MTRKELRLALGLTLREVADELGVVPATILRIEQGADSPLIPRLDAWLEEQRVAKIVHLVTKAG